MLKKLLQVLRPHKSSILVISAGVIVWSITMVKSGVVYNYGAGFWGANGHDGIWHIALSKSLAGGTWEMPVYTGDTVRNYHIGFDLLIAFVNKLTLIPVEILYFQIIPPILAVLIGLFVYKFILSWTKSESSAFWAVFFTYFSGSFGWLVTLFRYGQVSGESMFWSQQALSTLINPPFALSLVLIFAGLFFLNKGLEKDEKKYLVAATFLFGILIQIKVYAGILILLGLLVAGFFELLIKRGGVRILKVFTGALIISILVFSDTTGINKTIVYQPFWFLETMMGLADRLDWPRYFQAMVNYRLADNWLKSIPAYAIALGIFVLGNFGLRTIGFYHFIKKGFKLSNYHYIDLLMATMIAGGIGAPLLFLQNGTPWNTIQFFYYSQVFMGVLAGISFAKLIAKVNISYKFIAIGILIIVTIPTIYATLRHYLPSRPPAKISTAELSALAFLADQSNGVVLTFPFDRAKATAAENNPPRPLYLYESTAYVSAYSGKQVFLEDEVNLDITRYPWRERRAQVEQFYVNPNTDEVRKFISENKIKYFYWIRGQRALLGEDQLGIERIFENGEVDIYKVK